MNDNPWEITPQDIADQIDNAHYADYSWFEYRRADAPRSPYPGEHVAKGGRLLVIHWVHEGEQDGEREDHYIGLASIKRAIRKYAKQRKTTPRDILDNGDAGDSDNIMQIAVLGEIVYG